MSRAHHRYAPRHGEPWTESEDQILRGASPRTIDSYRALASRLWRTSTAVEQRLQKLRRLAKADGRTGDA